jgi:hypothetical protein
MAKDVIIIPADGDIQFKNEQGTESGRIAQSGDNLVFSNAVGDVLLGDGSSDIYVGDGINNVDIVFEQDGEIRGEVGSGVTLTLGSNDTTLYVTGSTLAFQKDGGNVGIGTTSPSAKLHVAGGAIFDTDTGNDPFYITRLGSTTEALSIEVTDSTVIFESIQDEIADTYGSFSFVLDGGTSYGNFIVRRGTEDPILHVDGNGKVGIGTTTPSTNLHIFDSGTIYTNLIEGLTLSNNAAGTNDRLPAITWDYGTAGTPTFAAIETTRASSTGGNLVFHTAQTNGTLTEGMRIDSSQNVGIGTTSPSEKLHVDGRVLVEDDFIIGRSTSTDATNKSFRFGVTHYTNAEEPFVPILGSSTSTGNFAYIGGGTSLANAATTIAFYTAANNTTTSGTERMRITNNGNVGIGTTSPGEKLHVYQGNIEIEAAAASAQGLIFSENGTQTMGIKYQGGQSGNPIDIFRYQDNTTKVRFTETGYVGIGTTSPAYKLDVDGDINLQLGDNIRFGSQLAMKKESNGELQLYGGTNSSDGGFVFNTWNGSAYEASATINNSKRLGVGTTSPNNELEILGSNSPRISLRTSNEAADEALELGFQVGTGANASSNSVGIIKSVITQATPSALIGDMEFQTNSGDSISTKMIIKGDGNVGINMDSPISSLHIGDGNDTVSSVLYSTDILNISALNTAPGFNIISAGSSEFNRGVFKATRSRGTLASPTAAVSGDYIFSLLGVIYDGGAGRATAGVEMRADGTVSSGNAPQRIEFQTGTTTSRSTRMTIKSSGNVGIGTTSPGTDLDVNGDTTTDNLYLATNIIHEGNTNTTIGFGTNTINLSTSTLSTSLSIGSTGTITLGDYGSGTKTGTAAYTLAVDSSGNIIETSGGGGGESFQDVTDTGNTTTNDITIGASSTPTATLNVVGSGTGDTTDALLVENSGLTDLFKITDSGNFYMKHATRTNSIIINNNDTTGTGASCTLIGNNAGYGSNLNGGFLTAVGLNAANNATGGGSSVAIGGYAAYSCGNLFGTVAIGNNAGRGAGNAYYNVAVGAEACKDSSIRYSVCIGGWAGRGTGTSLQDRNVYIGYQTAYNSNLNDGNTVIGARLQSSSTEGLSNTVIIGSDNAERLRIDSTGKFKFDSYGAGSFTGTQTVNLEADSSGNVIERLEERGTFSVSTDGTGDGSFSHSLGETPTIVLMTCDSIGGTVTTICVTGKSSTTISVKSSQRSATVTGYYIISS